MGALLLIFGIAGVLAAVTPLYLTLLAVASLKPAPRFPLVEPGPRLVVLVPAYNEEELVGRCVRSLKTQSYPAERYRVVVVADNCTDSTGIAAAREGAQVLVRTDSELRGKGYALRWALDSLLATDDAPEAVIIVDADSIADKDFVAQMAAAYSAGHESVQGDDLLASESPSARTELESIALLLRNRIRFSGRSALGMPATLCGNGMLLSASVLRSHPWGAFGATEDGEYAMTLREAGIPTVFAGAAKVYASTTSGGLGAYTQGVRWEGGRFESTRVWTPRLLAAAFKRRDAGLLTTVLDLLMPPLAATFGVLLVGTSVGLALLLVHAIPAAPVIPWLVGLGAIPIYVVVALLSARVPLRSYVALAAVPYFMWLKVRVYAHLLSGAESAWVRTQRPAEKRAQG